MTDNKASAFKNSQIVSPSAKTARLTSTSSAITDLTGTAPTVSAPQDNSNNQNTSSGTEQVYYEDNGEYTSDNENGESEDNVTQDGDTADDIADLGGRTLKMITYTGFFIEEETRYQELVYKEIKRLEEKHNFNLEWDIRRYSQVQAEFPSAFMAGINYADIFFTNRAYAFPLWVNKNMLVCLDDYIDFNEGPYANRWQISTIWKGKHYGINTSTLNVALYLMTYNKKILESEGLPDIFTLQQNGRWNWETMLLIALRTTKDNDGDGMIDQWGIDGQFPDFINKLVISNNTDFAVDIAGSATYNMSSLPVLQALQYASDLYNVHRVAVPPTLSLENNFAIGKAAIYTSYNYYSKSVFPQDCGIAFYPVGPNAQDYIVATTGGPFMAIPTTVDKPAYIAGILADIWDVWNENSTEFISLDQIFRQRIGTYIYNDNDLTTCYAASEKLYQLTHINYGNFGSIIENEIYTRIIREYMPVVSVIQSFKEKAQLAIRDSEN